MLGEQTYSVMPRPQLQDRELTLRAVEPKDIEFIREWRNAQMDVLRQTSVISAVAQQRYFAEHIWPSKISLQPSQILLVIERHGQLIGYGGLVHISWVYRRAEISFLLEPRLERNPPLLEDYFIRFLHLMQIFAFEDLQLKRLSTETYVNRQVHIRALESAGFRFEGRLKAHVLVDGKPSDALLHGLLATQWRSRRSTVALCGVLISSAGGKVPLIRAVQAAAEKLPEDIRIWAADTDPHAPARWEADAFWHMPPLKNQTVGEIIQQCQARGIAIILPTRDGELAFWARHREVFADAGIRVLVSSEPAIARCRDKLAFARFGAENALPIIPAETSPDAFGPVPLVVKERFGSGSRGIGLQLMPAVSHEFAHQLNEPIFQPFISGPEISIDGWVNRQGRVVGVVLRRRNRVISGESQVTTTFQDSALEAQAQQVLSALDLRGPVVLQAIVVEGKLHVIECNPRFGGASTVSIAVGLESLYWSLAEALGQDKCPVFHRSITEVKQVRISQDRWIYGSDF